MSQIGLVAKYNKSYGYGRLAVDYTSPVKIAIVNEVLIVALSLKMLFF